MQNDLTSGNASLSNHIQELRLLSIYKAFKAGQTERAVSSLRQFAIEYHNVKWCNTCQDFKALNLFKSTPQRPRTSSFCYDCGRQLTKNWKLKNQEQERERQNLWRINNRERNNQTKREYRLKNLEKMRRIARESMKRNPEKNRRRSLLRYARQKGAEGSFTKDDIQTIYLQQNGKCAWCSSELDRYETDHIVAITRGGSNYPSNLCVCYKACNVRKHAQIPFYEWMPPNVLPESLDRIQKALEKWKK